MNATITSLGGRAPPGRNTRTLSSESRSRVSVRSSRAAARFSSLRVRRSSVPAAGRHRARPGAPIDEALRRCSPSFSPTDRIAAHCDGCSAAWSSTSRTARSRSSGEYFDRSSHGPHPLSEWALRQSRYGSLVAPTRDEGGTSKQHPPVLPDLETPGRPAIESGSRNSRYFAGLEALLGYSGAVRFNRGVEDFRSTHRARRLDLPPWVP